MQLQQELQPFSHLSGISLPEANWRIGKGHLPLSSAFLAPFFPRVSNGFLVSTFTLRTVSIFLIEIEKKKGWSQT